MYFRFGSHCETQALDGLQRWAASPDVPADLLRNALAEVRRHEETRSTYADVLKSDYLMARQTVANPLALFARSSQQRSGKESLFLLPTMVPWERARRDRLLNGLAACQRDAETDYPTLLVRTQSMKQFLVPGPLDQTLERMLAPTDDPNELERRRQLVELFESDSFRDFCLSSFVIGRSTYNVATNSTCRLRLQQLSLALLVFQRETGRPAETLKELVERKILDRPLLDPFSAQEFHYRLSIGELLEWEPQDFETGSTEWAAVPEPFAPGAPGWEQRPQWAAPLTDHRA